MSLTFASSVMRMFMPVNQELGLSRKITANWDFIQKISWDFGIGQK